MPRIPIVSAQQGPGVLNLPPIQRQQGWEQVTEIGNQLAGIQGKIQAHQDELDLYRTETETQAELAQIKMDVALDPDYATHPEQYGKRAEEVKLRKWEVLSKTSPAAAQVYKLHAERMIEKDKVNVQIDANQKQIAQQGADTLVAGEEAARKWIKEPNATEQAKIKQDWFDVVDRSLAFGPEQKNKKKAQWDQWTATELISVDPTAARVALEKGSFPELDPTQRQTLIRSAEVVEARRDRLVIQEKLARQETTKQDFVKKWSSDTLTTKEILSSNLDAADQEHYLKLMEVKEGKPFVEDPRQVAHVLEDIRKGKITSNQQIEKIYINDAKKGTGLSYSSMERLQKELTDMETPDGRTLGHRKEKMFDGVKASIDKSVIGLKTDPEGSFLFLQYQEWVDSQMAAYKAQGKNPHDLLDPADPRYLARPAAVAPFQRSLQDVMREMSERFKRPDRPVLTPGRQRQSGETVEQYLKRTK